MRAPREVVQASRQAFVKLVDLCLDDEIDFVVVAGDVFDAEGAAHGTVDFFLQQVRRLQQQRIPMFVVGGDHEARRDWWRGTSIPESLFLFDAERPHTHCLEPHRVAIHGCSAPSVEGVPDVVEAFPPPRPGYFNIGLLHSSLEGRPPHAAHAPCPVPRLVDKGYDYWALGHVHRRELVRPVEPCILWSGSLQGRHLGETGPRGCTSVVVEDDWVELRHVSLDAVRWEELRVDGRHVRSRAELLAGVKRALAGALQAVDEQLLAARVVVVGTGGVVEEIRRDLPVFRGEVGLAAHDAGHGAVWLEDVSVSSEGS